METLVNPLDWVHTSMWKAMDTENQGVTLRLLSTGHYYIRETFWVVNHSKLKNTSTKRKTTRTYKNKEEEKSHELHDVWRKPKYKIKNSGESDSCEIFFLCIEWYLRTKLKWYSESFFPRTNSKSVKKFCKVQHCYIEICLHMQLKPHGPSNQFIF